MHSILRGIGGLTTVGVISALAFTLPAGEAHGNGGGTTLPQLKHTNWQQKCVSCHIAYAPAFLPRASWNA